jgi:hypothetical protein
MKLIDISSAFSSDEKCLNYLENKRLAGWRSLPGLWRERSLEDHAKEQDEEQARTALSVLREVLQAAVLRDHRNHLPRFPHSDRCRRQRQLINRWRSLVFPAASRLCLPTRTAAGFCGQ